VTLDPVFAIQNSMNPESIQACLLDDHKRVELPQSSVRPLPQISEGGDETCDITADDRMAGHFAAPRRERSHQPGRFAEFQRYEYDARIGTGGGV
jgi:hypothetical protein